MPGLNEFFDGSAVKQRSIYLDTDNHLKIKDSADVELMDIEAHGADGRHSYGAADALPAAGLRISQLKHAKNSSTGTGAQQTIAHGLTEAPTVVLITATSALAAAADAPYMSAAADATNIYITAGSGINYNWVAIL
ncbi:MAG: hypothetical protein RDU76_06255 [Candidatus Edwardsbacteria bacterium]|nr:hypothetical protein [Candidatus Edwardsbacteria bacterium]